MKTVNLCDNCTLKRSTCATLPEELLFRDNKVIDCWLYISNGLTETVGFVQY